MEKKTFLIEAMVFVIKQISVILMKNMTLQLTNVKFRLMII